MPLSQKTFPQIVSEMVSEWSGELGLQPSLTSGDPLLAIMQSVSLQQIFLQWLCKQVVLFARASTAKGEDLDSWMADFGFTREQPIQALGQVQFYLNIIKPVAVAVPVGTIIQNTGGAIQYQVVADTDQSSYNAQLKAYVIPAGQSSIVATVQAVKSGSAYNVQPQQLTKFASAAPGVDGVYNQFAISNGEDTETDVEFRRRFILWINSLSKNTSPSISAAVMGVQQGLDFILLENTDTNGIERMGFFTIVVDDGSGNTPQTILDKIFLKVEDVRGFTIQHTVVRATTLAAAVRINVKLKTDLVLPEATILTNVQDAIVQYINTLTIGESLRIETLAQIAKDADSNVDYVQTGSKYINSIADDLIATQFQIIRTTPSDVAVSAA